MPSNNNRINFQVGYNVDQASVNAVKKSLQDLQNIKIKDFNGPKKQLDLIKETAGKVLAALTKAFNVNLNSLNTKAFNTALNLAGLNIDKIYSQFSKAGAQGQVAFSRMASSVLTTNMQLKLTNSLVSQMGETMANTVKWGIASSVMNSFSNSVQQAFQYVKSLDSALTDIRIVTGDSTEQMKQFAEQANNAAQSLGRSTMDYTKAALTFYQQGLNEEDVQVRTQTVLKAQNITGAGKLMADYLTAVWNGYKVANEEAELYVDKLAAVADTSASNMSELAVAMSKVASTANMLGVPVDSLNAQIATIVATTRQAPESVGNALKTIYSRINDIATGADDALISLGNYSSKMAEVGINVLDANGRLRDTGDVIDEIGGKWATLSREQQIYLARTMAGQRQYNNLLALFENWDKYTDLVNVSLDAQGTTMLKNAIYMESLGAKMEQLGAAGEKVKSALINEEDLKGLVDFGTGAVNLFGNLIESIGGGRGALLAFGSIFTQVFSGTIAKELNNVITNFQNVRNNVLILKNDIKQTQLYGASKGYSDNVITEMVLAKKAVQEYYQFMDAAQINLYNNIVKEIGLTLNLITLLREKINIAKLYNSILENTAKISGQDPLDQLDDAVTKALQLNEILSVIKGSGLNQVTDYDFFANVVNQVEDLKQTIGTGFLDELYKEFEDLSILLGEAFAGGESAIKGASNLFQRFLLLARLFNLESGKGNNFVLLQQLNEEALKRLNAQLDQTIQKQENYLQGIIQFSKIKTFVNMAAGLGQLASGFNNIINITKIWQNETLSAGEKIIQTFTNLGMTLSMTLSGFSQVKKGFDLIIKQGQVLAAAKLLETEASFKAMVAKQMEAGMSKQAAIAATLQAIAEQGLAVSLWEVAKAGAAAMAPLLPFVAIAGVVAMAIYLIYQEYTKYDAIIEKSNKKIELSKKNYNDLKESYDGLKSSLENYHSAQDAISQMTSGTQLWRDAIRESNDAVLDLIKNYPELKDAVLNVNGQLILNEQAQQELLLKTSTQVNNARLASIQTLQQATNEAIYANAYSKTRGIISSYSTFSAGNAGGVSPVYVTLEQTKALIETYGKYISSSEEERIQAIKEQTGLSEEIINQMIVHLGDIEGILNQLNDNSEATKIAYETIASEQLEIADKLQGTSSYSNLSDLEKQITNTIVGSLIQSETESREARINQILNEKNQEDILSVIDRYNTATGQQLAYNSINDDKVILSLNGLKIEKSKLEIATAIATALALLRLGVQADQASRILQNIENVNGDSSSNALRSFLGTGSLGGLSKKELAGIDFLEVNNFLSSNWRAFGANSLDLFIQGFQDAYKLALADWNFIAELPFRVVKNTLEGLINNKDFSLLTAKNISEALNDTFKQVGTSGVISLNNLFQSLDKEDADLLSKTLASGDFSTPEGLKELEQTLSSISDGSITASDEWKDFKNEVENTHFENPLDSIFDRQLKIEDATKNIKKYSIISEEDYNNLFEINSLIEGLFTRVANGYEFMGQKSSLIELLVGGENDYISAANRLDALQESTKRISSSVEEGYEFYGKDQNAISDVVLNTITAIKSQNNSELLWSALGFNLDYLTSQLENYYLKINEIKEKLAQGLFISLDERKEVEALRLEFLVFLNTVANSPLSFKGLSDSLRLAGALGALTISKLNDMLFSGGLGDLEDPLEKTKALLTYANALQKVSDVLMQDLGFDVDQYEDFVKLLQSTNLEYEDNEYLARQVAKANMRISKGMDDLIDNWDDWNDALLDFQENADFSSLAENWNEIRLALANLFDSDELTIDLLGPDFIANNLDKILAVKNGTEGAYEELAALMDQLLILNAYGVSDFSQLDQDIQDAYNLIQQTNADATILVGAVFTGEDALVDAFNRIVENANWTSAQAQAAFAQMGYDVLVLPKESTVHTDSLSTEYYVPPTYRMVPKEFNFGPFGRGTMLLPELDTGGHYESGGTGTKQTYEPGAYAIRTVTKNGKGFGGNISRGAAKSAAPRSGGGKGGGGKGGGGGKSPKAVTPKKATQIKPQQLSEAKESIEDRSDVYHDINLALEKQEDKLDDIQNKLKKLVNRDRLKNLQQQNKLLEKQKDLLDLKSGIAATLLVRLRNEIVGDLGNAIKFDKNGLIANYNAALDKARDNYNDAIADYNQKVLDAENAYNRYVDQYNAMSGDAQEVNKQNLDKQKDIMLAVKKLAQKTLDVEKDKYDAIKNNIKEYEDTLLLQRDIAKKQQLIQDQMYENLIAMSKIKVDLSIDTGDFERDWLDFENKFIKKLDNDDFLGNAKASAKELMSYFNSNQVQLTANQIRKIRNLIDVMNRGGTSNIYGTNLAQAKEDLEEYMKQQMDDLLEVQDMIDNIKDNYLDAIDDANDKMEDQIDQYERVNDLINHNVKLVELLYGDKAYDSMLKYYNLQKANNERELESLKKQQEYWQEKMNNEVVGSDAWKKFKDNLDNVTDNLNNKLEDMIDNLANQFENRVNGIIARLNNALTGGRGLDFLDEQWDYINNYDDQFLDTFETKTGIDEVERLYQSTIDGLVGSPKSQQALNKLMNDQLKLLRLKDHLTEYDLERAKASLEVLKARLALELARDNKTKMRLRRDSQGNYTYQYVADELKLGELQSALADAQANLYNTDKEHYKQNLNNLYDTYKDYILKMKDLTEEYNQTQDEEERKRIQGRIDLLKNSTAELMSGLTEDNKYLLNYLNGSFFDGMGVDTSALTMEEQMLIMQQNIPQMESLIQDLADTIVGLGGIIPATADMMKEISQATQLYDLNVRNMLETAGTDLAAIEQAIDGLGNALDQNIVNAQNLITTNDELINSCRAQILAIEELLDYMDKYLNKVMSVLTLLANLRSAYNTGQNLNGSNLTADEIEMTSWGMDTTTGMEYTGNPKTDAAAIKQQIDALMSEYEKFLTAMSIATFDTGGYTGTWGDAEGRLAFLHQGELVLNQDDTRNILTAVQTVRAITGALNGAVNGELSSIISGATGFLGGLNKTEQLDQNVHIEANFPNVTQHTEIEQAFENLVNMASMRASKYRD